MHSLTNQTGTTAFNLTPLTYAFATSFGKQIIPNPSNRKWGVKPNEASAINNPKWIRLWLSHSWLCIALSCDCFDDFCRQSRLFAQCFLGRFFALSNQLPVELKPGAFFVHDAVL